ncbi:MAG: sialate O-acetylesterase, partial [Opitutae bacterium]|nr:sialate O-acetylesterase [Opitutae bacterium]
MKYTIRFLLLLLPLLAHMAMAEVRMPNLFGDHMVLQRDKAVRIWGWADPGESVEVSFADQTLKTKGLAEEGRWS